MEKKIEIKDLRVSFRTNDGTVKAVRGIDLDLYRGETLAIVGESGSGKSVTAKAVMGILAPNSIVESGEIIYDGKDLLKIEEEEFHDYRGNKLSMIFQDPLSSLNPIMKIGKQLTEAMLLNGRANQRTAKKEFTFTMNLLKENVKLAGVSGFENKVDEFIKFSTMSSNLEGKYNLAYNSAMNVIDDIDDMVIDIPIRLPKDVRDQVKYLINITNNTYNDYVVSEQDELKTLIDSLKEINSGYKDVKESSKLIDKLKEIKEVLDKAVNCVKPDFFSMGYYLTKNPEANVKVKNIEELNDKMINYLNDNFMQDFKQDAIQGIKYIYNKALEGKKEAVKVIEANYKAFENELDRSKCNEAAKVMIEAVNKSIDRLAIIKDSNAYTFGSSIKFEIIRYFEGIKNNDKNIRKYEKAKSKVDKLVAKGQDYHKATPPVIVDLDLVKSNINKIINNLLNSYKKIINGEVEVDFDKYLNEVVAFLKKQSSKSVYKVTNSMAKNKAIKLMKEVGIAKARQRYYEYPFQFSGGMRQRIVIAIALAANPDILICDEPTTALDVTIQAQILELINDLKKERDLSVIFITHDLGVVANMADRISVMYAGKVVEHGTVDEIFYEPAHPYTWALLASMPDLETVEKLDAIPGTPPNMVHPPVGDAFAARNKYAMQIDFEKQPPMFEISPTHTAATWLLHPNAPKVEPPKIVTDRIKRMKSLMNDGGEANE